MVAGALIWENQVLEVDKDWNQEYLEQLAMEGKKIEAF